MEKFEYFIAINTFISRQAVIHETRPQTPRITYSNWSKSLPYYMPHEKITFIQCAVEAAKSSFYQNPHTFGPYLLRAFVNDIETVSMGDLTHESFRDITEIPPGFRNRRYYARFKISKLS